MHETIAAAVVAGIVEPVKSGVEAGLRLGVGKQEQENFYMDADNVNRKKLEVELQAEEDEERKDKREVGDVLPWPLPAGCPCSSFDTVPAC